MAQSSLDGGSGGWGNFLGGVAKLAGNEIANKISGSTATSAQAERTADHNQQEDLAGTPTNPQKAAVSGLGGLDARTLLIGGGVLLVAVAVMASRN